ncbi:MAG: TonB-dependent receptor [Methylococcales bacterium]|nr:TonB-dependent receptor [Methylococcales bacterium]
MLIIQLAPCYLEASTLRCPQWVAKTISFQGKVEAQYFDTTAWQKIKQDKLFCEGDKIRIATSSKIKLRLEDQSFMTLDQNTRLTFSPSSTNTPSWFINLINGSAFFRSRKSLHLNVQTPFINAVHKGTEFLVTVDNNQTEITVFDGQVDGINQRGKIHIQKGFTGVATKSQPPYIRPLTIPPKDAVQWTLYYPPLIDYQQFKSVIFSPAIHAYQQGNTFQALALIEKIPTTHQNEDYLLLKASLLLSAGRVDEALKLIESKESSLLTQQENGIALALRSIIAVTKNRQSKALELAKKAVSLAPQSVVAHIALSYAYQSKFNIELALKTTQKATQLSPDNALAWARLAELQLATGERSDALESATKAQQLNPNLSHTHIVLGFSYLAQTDTDKAEIAFNQAINLNSADPLAQLGLGLAKIRKGKIAEGTHHLETAVTLDPDDAMMRSYLGKAYYELRNEEYASTELNLAKEMDPNDPTPWFYGALLKQTTNQPVEALHDMEKAIELNNNRGVYRSTLLLDEDSAARSANMARIYQDLGFNRVAQKQAWTSLNQDFTNPSAHRFLSDTLQGKPRHRIARASELLQAQLLQPINAVPVQPQLTSENIGILNSTGPGSLSSNEYDSLFTSNGAHIFLNGAVGSNNTLTDSAIISGVYDQFSLSVGQFHFQTDGFRENSDYKQNVYNIFAQAALTPDFNVQLEFKREDITTGDVAFRVLPDSVNSPHSNLLRTSKDIDTIRLGTHYQITPEQDIIFSSIYKNFIDQTRHPDYYLRTRIPSYQFEAQYLFHPKSLNIIVGIGGVSTNDYGALTHTKPHYFNSYFYSNIEIYKTLIATLGVSYDLYHDSSTKTSQLNPKVGLIWTPTKYLTIRGASFRTLKRPLVSNQTIEPTQVAGFNQFYDDINGTKSWLYGLGFDYKPFKNIFIGGEITWRNTSPSYNGTLDNEKREHSSVAYLYWTPFNWFTFSSKYQFNEHHRKLKEDSIPSSNYAYALSTITKELPLNLHLYHSNGLFSNFSGTFVNQRTEYENGDSRKNGKNRFWIFNTSIGFRLPKKTGSLSLEVRNLFNKNFQYHSNFDASGPTLPKFIPEREVFLKLSLTY